MNPRASHRPGRGEMTRSVSRTVGTAAGGLADPTARPRCSAFVATSLDGFIARPGGEIDWLDALRAVVPDGEDCGFAAYMARVDALVMGRVTFEQVCTFDPWPYGSTHVYVLSRSLDTIEVPRNAHASLHACDPAMLVEQAGRDGRKSLYIDGGLTIRSFIDAGLLDEITITTVPVLLGAGRPLFGTAAAVPLALLETRAWPFGFVQCRYALRPDGLPDGGQPR